MYDAALVSMHGIRVPASSSMTKQGRKPASPQAGKVEEGDCKSGVGIENDHLDGDEV